ncbi:hypothetical protein [Microvirga vignae]|uniref:hypothetical protein n=1 Tax=Microvirga vignae TaxID=1225564 RepID=UPI000A9599E1|nr:hypothetical protein [Microvirga vignae]
MLSFLRVEELGYRVFFRIIAPADEVQIVLRNPVKASDNPRLLLTIIVGQQALLIGLAVASYSSAWRRLSTSSAMAKIAVGSPSAVTLRRYSFIGRKPFCNCSGYMSGQQRSPCKLCLD